MNLVEINNVAIGIKEYEGKRVITFKDIELLHDHAKYSNVRFVDIEYTTQRSHINYRIRISHDI